MRNLVIVNMNSVQVYAISSFQCRRANVQNLVNINVCIYIYICNVCMRVYIYIYVKMQKNEHSKEYVHI